MNRIRKTPVPWMMMMMGISSGLIGSDFSPFHQFLSGTSQSKSPIHFPQSRKATRWGTRSIWTLLMSSSCLSDYIGADCGW